MRTVSEAFRADRRARVAAVLAELVARFPRCFAPDGAHRKPLARRISRAVMERCPEIGRTDIRRALRFYTSDTSYLRQLVAGATRIDLDGQPCGHVHEQEAVFAQGRLRVIAAERARRGAPEADVPQVAA